MQRMKTTFRIIPQSLLALGLVMSLAGLHFSYAGDDKTPDVDKIVLLRAGLKPGTLAFSRDRQLHPTESQTGPREENKKFKTYESLIKDNGKKFSKELFREDFE